MSIVQPPRRRWTFSLWTLLVVMAVAAVPLGVWVRHVHLERLQKSLAQPLIDAADRGDTPAVQQLLDRGANIDSIVNGRFPWTPLMHAAFRGRTDVVRLLLERSANINHECLDGFTALTLAASEDHWPIVRLLVDHGGDVTHQDATGQSALSIAKQIDDAQLVEFLERHRH